MAKDIIVIGAGGFGREVLWTLERINEKEPVWNILGFADDDPKLAGKQVEGYPVLGSIEETDRDHPGAAIFIGLGDNELREKLYRRLRGHDFPIIVDPSADVAAASDIRHGTFIGPRAVVSVGTKLGKLVIVNARAGVGHDCTLGDFAQVSPGASLSGHTTVGDSAFIATNACTAPGVTVGKGAKIAAGTPVYANVEDGATVSPFGSLKGQA